MDMVEDVTLVDGIPASGASPSSITGAATEPAPPRKTRVALACQRCKRRKQRCNGSHPICSNCRKSGSECIYERTARPQYPGGKSLYISALEERIAFLEERMPEHGQDHFVSPVSPTLQSRPDGRRQASRECSPVQPRLGSVNESVSDDAGKLPLVDGVAYLSLCASGTTGQGPEPFYVGSSSGATIAKLIQHSIYRGHKSRDADPVSSSPPVESWQPASSHADSDDVSPNTDSSNLDEFPYGPQAQTLFAVFFDRLHTRWPILDRMHFCGVFEKQWTPNALAPVERSILHLIYAISARFLQLMKRNCDVSPERHFTAALKPMDSILEQHNLATVQFLTLLAIYGQRSPYGAGLWSQVRYAMTLCIDLGMHRKQTTQHQFQRNDAELRRRVFWACYCLDRMTTMTLGRTFAIADRDINVELPVESQEFWQLMAARPEDWSSIRPFIHIVKLRQLQSKVFRTVWRVDIDVLNPSEPELSKLDRKIDALRQRLGIWLHNIPKSQEGEKNVMWMYDLDSASQDSGGFFKLQYHKTILSLYTALLPRLDPSDLRFVSVTQSAAAICSIYKALNAQQKLSFTLVALHSCFNAGLTMVYCLWKESSLFDFSMLEATRACSLCLTIFGEKIPGAVKYRDIFDMLSGSLLKSILGDKPSRRDSGGGRGTSGHSSHSSSHTRSRVPLDLEMGTYVQADAMQEIPGVAAPSAQGNVSIAPPSSDMLLGAARNVFMQVDEQEPESWNGWRMLNEMVQADIAMAPRAVDHGQSRTGIATSGETAMGTAGFTMGYPPAHVNNLVWGQPGM